MISSPTPSTLSCQTGSQFMSAVSDLDISINLPKLTFHLAHTVATASFMNFSNYMYDWNMLSDINLQAFIPPCSESCHVTICLLMLHLLDSSLLSLHSRCYSNNRGWVGARVRTTHALLLQANLTAWQCPEKSHGSCWVGSNHKQNWPVHYKLMQPQHKRNIHVPQS